MKMSSIQHQLDYTPPPLPSSSNKISPALLFVIVIVAVLFFISGFLHLLVRFLTKHHNSSSSSAQSNIDRYPDSSTTNTLQRQLQQLFHLHDSGLDQTFIDSLPVFMYKELVGVKEPFDCPVCLCEFSDKDKLRMLPFCNHAFHINCIDTWLLSNSTCPLCRGTLFSPIQNPIQNPIFEFDDMREDEGFPSNGENGCSLYNHSKSVEMEQIGGNAILQVRLGKFRTLDDDGDDRSAVGETSSSSLDDRRCFSMGSYEYVVRDANLMVSALRHDSSDGSEEKKISFGGKTDSYSESKIWLWSSNKHKLTTSFGDQERPSYLS